MTYILALDQGTTSSRAIAFDHKGVACATAQREFTQHFPQDGWVEHDAQEIWESQLAVAQDVVGKLGAENIAGIGITNQRETTVVWDRATGKPIHNAIVWQDRRTAPLCEKLVADGHAAEITAKTGLVVDAYFSGTKVRWLLDNVEGARAKAERGELAFGTIDSWLIYNLTGGARHVTDATNASRTMLYDIHRGEFCAALLDLLDVPRSMMPDVLDSSGEFGQTEASLFGHRLKIGGVAGDQQAALFGQACWKPGMLKNTYGTGCFLLMNTGTKAIASSNQLLTTVAWQLGGERTYALEGSVFMGGATVQWLRDGLGVIDDSAEVEALATSVEDTGGVMLVPAFTGLGAPHWDPYARGALLGLSRGTTAAHVARAALEGIALQSMDLIDAMRDDASIDVSELRVDGGASHNTLMMQCQADLLDVRVVRAHIAETTALGAAYLAGLATGFWQDMEEIGSQWRVGAEFSPSMDSAQRDALKARWHEAVSRAKGWASG
ncbi:MAG: glycerol kinase GlpK [Gammaproteobacteria bacterium]